MNNPTPKSGQKSEQADEGQRADAVSQRALEDELRYQGVDATHGSPTKDAQVAKELKEEESKEFWNQKKSPDRKPDPASGTEQQPEQDNDYFNGMSP